MVKKSTTGNDDDDSQFASAVRHSAAQIWQAGLGAFAKAQEEGNRVFAKLVQEGSALQERSRAPGGATMAGMPETVSKVASGVRKQAAGSLDKLEQVFEDRVARALGKLGVPTLKDIEALSERVAALSRQVDELSGQQPPAKAPRARKAAAKPAAAKPPAQRSAAKPAAKAITPARKAAARKSSRKSTAP